MQRPYGCAEQSISAAYPSLMLLRNYKQTGNDFRFRARAERYLNDGYSRLLNYREEDGGFSYWGRREPDVAVTAYALRFLLDASDVIQVDEEVINGAREWLLKIQRPDGSWRAHEYWGGEDVNRRSALLTAYDYPGNARELANVIERAVIVAEGKKLEEHDLPLGLSAAVSAQQLKVKPRSLAQLEAAYISEMLAATGGNKTECARILGISRKNLYEKIARYRIN